MARGKSEPNIEQGKRSANRMPKSFPCMVSVTVPFTHSGCRALGSLENLPGPQQQVTQRWREWDSWAWGFAPRTSTLPLEMGLWTNLTWCNGFHRMSGPSPPWWGCAIHARTHAFQSQETQSIGPSRFCLSRVTNAQNNDLWQWSQMNTMGSDH